MQTGFSFKFSRAVTQLAVFLIPFYFFRFSLGPLRTNIFEIAILAAALSTVYYLLSAGTKFKFGSIWPYLFLLISFISIFIAPDKTAALGIFKGWFLTPIILYFLIINLFVKDDLPKLIKPLFASFSVVALWGFLQSFGAITTLFYQKGDSSFLQYLTPGNFRIFGPFESPNYLAMFLAPVFFLCLPLLNNIKNGYLRLGVSVFLTIGMYDLLLTGSRAGIIAFLVPFILLVLIRNNVSFKQNLGKKWLTVLSLIIVVAVFVFSFLRVASSRGESNSERLQIWHYALDIGRSTPIFGAGLGSFQTKIAEVSKNNIDFRVKTLPYALHPHNVYLAMWLNLGILGLIIFFILIMNFFRQLWPERKDIVMTCLMAAMSAVLIHGLFDTTYFKNDLSAIFWLILAIGVIVKNDAKTLSKN